MELYTPFFFLFLSTYRTQFSKQNLVRHKIKKVWPKFYSTSLFAGSPSSCLIWSCLVSSTVIVDSVNEWNPTYCWLTRPSMVICLIPAEATCSWRKSGSSFLLYIIQVKRWVNSLGCDQIMLIGHHLKVLATLN